MSSRRPSPWRSQQPTPPSTIPAKRSATSRHDQPAKRYTNAQEEAWVADEDRFVLQQAKKKAALRIKGGRARPIDWLAVTLRFVDQSRNLLDEDVEDGDLEVVDPESVLEGVRETDLSELEKEIENYLTLETDRSNREYWGALKIVCKDRRRKSQVSPAEARGTGSVSADIDRLLAPKTYQELEKLEIQVKKKLSSDEPIDYDYWEQLLRELGVWKAKAKLRRVSQDILNERLQALRKQQQEAALAAQQKIQALLGASEKDGQRPTAPLYDVTLDPQPSLKLLSEEKSLIQVDAERFMENLVDDRRKVIKMGYVPAQNVLRDQPSTKRKMEFGQTESGSFSMFAPVEEGDVSQATMVLYEKEVARGIEEGEEIFTGEEELKSARPQWATKYKARKPRYFNRVQMGYEWNKYNQTHYDHDNPPPKVVQGYKFNVFYPDLIDKTKAPTYKIHRENGRKRGQTFAPAGEDDTCVIRFIAGPPYEDLAFRIVDKEWDYSAKRERGFKSSFDKGILQLHFQFKKVYYRK